MPTLHLPTGPLEIPCPTGQVSDGYHTFDELYEHRCILFLALLRAHPQLSWCSKLHEDGTMFEGWFEAGMDLPTGQVTYHFPERLWPLAAACSRALPRAPKWDGHTPAQALERLRQWLSAATPPSQRRKARRDQMIQANASPKPESEPGAHTSRV